MRVARERLIMLALSVLMRWSDRAAEGPAKPDVTVRLALAVLYTCGSSGDRRCYDEFWRLLSDPGLESQHKEQRDHIRRSYCDTCIKGIATDVGAPHTPDFWASISNMAERDDREPDGER